MPEEIERWTTTLPELTVLTANVGNGQAPDERLIAAILASKADIVGLQELNRRQAAVLRERLADVYPERISFADSYEGKAILSRYPVLAAWPMSLVPDRPDCAARIDLDGREITVIVAHPRPRVSGAAGSSSIASPNGTSCSSDDWRGRPPHPSCLGISI